MPYADKLLGKQKAKERYLKRREYFLEQRRLYVLNNKEKCLRADRNRYDRIKEEPWFKERQHVLYLRRYSDPEYRKRIIEQSKSHHAAHPEMVKAAHKRRWSDPVYRKKVTEYNREWFKNNRSKHREANQAWRKNNKGAYHALLHRRRALQLGATINPKSIRKFMQGVRHKESATCYYCQSVIPIKKVHFDHIIPLSKGGGHSVENLCVSCSHCNQTKHNKLVKDWMILGQQLLEL